LVVFFSLLADPSKEDPDNLSSHNHTSGNGGPFKSYARLSGMKLRIGRPTKLHRASSFYSPEKAPVYHLSSLSKMDYDDRYSASSQYTQQTQSDEQCTRLSAFFSEDLNRPDSNIMSPTISNNTDDRLAQLSAFLGEHSHLQATDHSRTSSAIPSTLYSDDVSLSGYLILNKSSSIVPSGRCASSPTRLSGIIPDIKTVRFMSPVMTAARSPTLSVSDSLVVPYPSSIYSQYLREDDAPNMPEPIYKTPNSRKETREFKLPSQVLAAMRSHLPGPTSHVPKPF
jgi:hypothetical protein